MFEELKNGKMESVENKARSAVIAFLFDNISKIRYTIEGRKM